MNISSIGFRLARKTRPIHLPAIHSFDAIAVRPPVPTQITFNPPETTTLEQEPLLAVPRFVVASKRTSLSTPEIDDVSQSLTFIPISDSVKTVDARYIHSEALLPVPSSIVTSKKLQISAPDIDLALFENIDGYPEDIEPPEIDNIFVPISAPPISGRSYGTGSSPASPRTLADRLSHPSIPRMCPHGTDRLRCSVCTGQRRTPAVRRPPTPDVFSQLWFVLQPPILERIDKPDVLPSGKRPYDFQIAGIKWLSTTPRALLADEMGLGKTIQAIMAMRVLFQRGEIQKVLVVSPVSVASTWMKELRDWAPELRGLRVNETAANRSYQWRTPAEVYVVSYDMLRSDVASNIAPIGTFDLCIIDEAQNIKNPSAQRSRAVKQVQANYRWALTGTPLENSLSDTISIFDFLNPPFIRRTFEGQYYISPERFKKEISPYTLRRTLQEVEIQLPEITYQDHWLELTGKQRAAYNSAETYGVGDIRKLGQQATRIHVLALISRLKQICNLEETTGQSCKLDFLQEQLNELTVNNEKALVFSQYPNVTLKNILPKLRRYSPLLFEGSLTEQMRTRYVEEFQDGDEHRVMLMGVKSGGTGITLTRANHVFHFDHWWNPATEDQASKRAHRIGQNRPVFVTSLYTANTIEERIFQLLESKRHLFRQVFDDITGDDVAKRLSDEELFGLFGLTAPQRPDSSPIGNRNQRDLRNQG